tara:strand:- start:1005 stop:1391 length:387 start_codon:yes stop_codon:yes gene_type:complete
MSQRVIATELTPATLEQAQKRLGRNVMIVKIGASWCAPCRKIKGVCDNYFASLPSNVVCADIDVDECIELYATLKRRKMVNGVPTILAFYGDVSRDQWYIPDDSVSGGDISQVKNFFERCASKARTLN